MFSIAGDSMLFVDPRGRRVVNEKLPYNELAQAFFRWDGSTGTYPDLVLVQIWDQRSRTTAPATSTGV
jgi:3-oxosteroid 1-dehydrogenase